jgi:Uma2 family endonuclease
MSTIEHIEYLTLEAYARLYEQEGPFEIIDGERKPLMPPIALHGLMIRALFRLLDAYCAARELGEVITEMPYVLVYDSNWVKGSRVPDLMFFAALRWKQYIAMTDAWEGKPFVLVPDLAVEVVSPHDLYTDIQDRVDRYLDDGVRLIWVIDPQRKRVSVYEGERHTKLNENDSLSAGEVIPGISIPLFDLFNSAKQAQP